MAIFGMTVGVAFAHPAEDGEHHHHEHEQYAQAESEETHDPDLVSGQGDLKFRVLHTGKHLPAEAQMVLVNAHGGFAVDRRDGQGEVYFALPGAGIIKLSADLSKAEMIETPDEMRDSNMHNTTIWHEGEASYLTFPANSDGKVFTTTPDGELVNALPGPEDITFTAGPVNAYFESDGKFVPTDVEYLGGSYFVTTGYSPLDYVLTAGVTTEPFDVKWQPQAFGGKGTEPGQFGTGHGITVTPDGENLAIADRPHAEIDHYSPKGEYLNTVMLPEGSFPCDVDFVDDYSVVGCLHGPDREKGAPIYVLENDEVVSTVMIKEELGLDNFQPIHNAVMVNRDGRYYIIAQAWNPGGFAVLEQVVE